MSLETLVKPEQQYKNGTDSWPWFFLLKKPCRQWKYVSRPKCFSMALPYQKSRSAVFMLPEKGVPSAVIATVHRWCWDCTAGLEESSTGEVPQLQKFCCRNCWAFAAPCKSKCVCHVACVCVSWRVVTRVGWSVIQRHAPMTPARVWPRWGWSVRVVVARPRRPAVMSTLALLTFTVTAHVTRQNNNRLK